MATPSKKTPSNLDLKELKEDLSKSSTLMQEFTDAIQKSVKISIDEFVTLRENLKALGVGFEELEKLTLKVQKSQNDEIELLMEKRKEVFSKAKEEEAKILLNHINEYNKLTDNGKKEADPEKYKALLKQKEDALQDHNLKTSVQIKAYTDTIKKQQDESQKLSLKGVTDYYGSVNKTAHETFTSISKMANKSVSEIDNFLQKNTWANGVLEIGKEYKNGLDQMTKWYDQQDKDIEAKYKKKKDKLEAEQLALQKPQQELDTISEKLKTSDTRKERIESELNDIENNPSNWKFDSKGQEENYTPKKEGQTNTDNKSEASDGINSESVEGQTFNSASTVTEDEKTEKRKEQLEKRKEYLNQLLEEEKTYNTELTNSKKDAQDKITEIAESGFKTEADIAAEMAELNKKELEEKEKVAKEKEKIAKQKAKIEYVEKLGELTKGIITSTASTAEGAAKALAKGPILGPILAAMIAAQGAVQIAIQTKQLAAMKNTSPFENGGLLDGKRHSQGGMRIEGTNIEVEGGEYVVNRESTRKNIELIQYINRQRRELGSDDLNNFFTSPTPNQRTPFLSVLEEGGRFPMMPLSSNFDAEILQAVKGINLQPRVSVTDINTVQEQMARVDEWTGL